jgi:hypothetical protein
MTKILSLRQTPGEPESAPASSHRLDKTEQKQAELLELRSETGTVYVRPSRWQRVRLRWAFRHFRKLPPELLSRRDQRLIEKLSRSAVVIPALPIARASVFGVVEKVRSTRPASGLHLVTQQTGLSATASGAPSGVTQLPGVAAGLRAPDTRDTLVPSVPWGALGALAAIGLVVVLASAYQIPPFSSAAPGLSLLPLARSVASPLPSSPPGPQRWIAPLPPELPLAHEELTALFHRPNVTAQTDTTSSRVQAAGTTLPRAATVDSIETTPEPVTLSPSPSVAPSLAPSPATERGVVSELPQGPFARPIVSEPNMVGELQLRALIGADGSVKEVTVVSGDPRLAEAGVRAVRQWHYPPHSMTGSTAEMETHIKMSFFGEDAVSIASVAN